MKGEDGHLGDGVDELSGVLKLLSDQTRLGILLALHKGEQNVAGICRMLRLAQPAVSHHLGLLRTSQMVENRRVGKQVYYRLGRNSHRHESGIDFSVGRYLVRLQKRSD